MNVKAILVGLMLSTCMLTNANAITLQVTLPTNLPQSTSVDFDYTLYLNCQYSPNNYHCDVDGPVNIPGIPLSKFPKLITSFNTNYAGDAPVQDPVTQNNSSVSVTLHANNYQTCTVDLSGKSAVALSWSADGACQIN